MQKGFIQIPILVAVVLGVFVIGSVGYFGLQQYQDYKIKNVEEERQIEINRQLEKEQEQGLQDLLTEQSEELKKQKFEIDILKKKQSKLELSHADIIEQWMPSIARITCSFDFEKIDAIKIKNWLEKYNVDTLPITTSGSGFLKEIKTRENGTVIALITNQHVLRAHNGFSVAYSCKAVLPGNHKYSFTIDDVHLLKERETGNSEIKFLNEIPYITPDADMGWLWIKNPDTYTKNLAVSNSICQTNPRIGDDIIILGYPGIGSSQSITATEGIISGIEDSYYLTSAKVEHGNSGGAAILKEKNCYAGIPTFAVTGSVESLSRILTVQSFEEGF